MSTKLQRIEERLEQVRNELTRIISMVRTERRDTEDT